MNVAGKAAFITGGGGMLGRQWSAALGKAGAIVHNLDVPQFNVTDSECLHEALQLFGVPEVLICAAAIDAKPGQDAPTDPYQAWDNIIRVNLTGVAQTCQVIGNAMTPGGSIILIGSMYGMVGPDQRRYDGFVKPAAYSASKAALYGLCRYLAVLLGPRGVRVNCVTFGAMSSPSHPPRFVESMRSAIPLGRLAEPGEWNGPILFLASDASSYMTGANIVVDGGYTAW